MLCGLAEVPAAVGAVHGCTVMVTALLRIGPPHALLTCTRNDVVAVSGGVTKLELDVVPPTGEPPWNS
jgi:hypothetical protein